MRMKDWPMFWHFVVIFAKKTLRYLLFAIILLITACNEESDQKTEAKGEKVEKSPWTNAVEASLAQYYLLSEEFVQWDSNGVKEEAVDFQQTLTDLKQAAYKVDSTTLYKTDSLISTATRHLTVIASDSPFEQRRRELNNLSVEFYNYLKEVRFE